MVDMYVTVIGKGKQRDCCAVCGVPTASDTVQQHTVEWYCSVLTHTVAPLPHILYGTQYPGIQMLLQYTYTTLDAAMNTWQ